MGSGGRSWRRRLRRAWARPGSSPARTLLLVLLAVAGVTLVGAVAALPLLVRARFEARNTALEQQLLAAELEGTRSFREAARAALVEGERALRSVARDAATPFSAVEEWAAGHRVLPPAFGCRPLADAPDELLAAVRAVVTSAGARDGAALERTTRAWLALRANHQLEPGLDLVTTLEPLEAAADSGLVEPALLRALFSGGLEVGHSRVPSLEQQALLGLPSSCDAGLVERTARLLVKAGVSDQTLRARLTTWQALPLEPPPAGAGTWALGDRTFAQVEPGGRGILLRSEAPMQAARTAIAATGASSEVRAHDAARWVLLDDAKVRPVALDELMPARARFDATLRALSLAAATLMAGGALLVVVDRRRRKSAEALRRDLVAAVAHELKTPLASMRLQADALERWINDERAGKTLARLQEDVDALEGLVENVLSWGRLSRGGVVLREAPVSLFELCREALERATREQPGLHVELGGDDVTVRADGELLRLVLGNLVRNAWRHNPRSDKSVRVVVERSGSLARVRIADNGVGIEEAERARIFRPFERSLTLARGSGLGLTLGKEIAALHGGDVRLAETGAHGSTFVLELPA